jgi:RND family efflux transporter MFP subunit
VVVRGGVSGLVTAVAVRPGDRLEAGDVVATLDRRPLEAAAEAASAAVVEAELAEAVAVAAGASATPEDLAGALFAAERAEIARTALERAESALRAATILAPGAGTVLEVAIVSGAPYSAGASAVVLAGPGFEVDAALDQADVPAVAIGTAVRVVPDAFPAVELAGTVAELAPQGASAGGAVTFAVRFGLEEAPVDLALRPGMTATIVIPSVVAADALLVPAEAIETVGRRSFVQVLRDGEEVTVEVTLGLRQGGLVQIAAGDLTEGERVRVAG